MLNDEDTNRRLEFTGEKKVDLALGRDEGFGEIIWYLMHAKLALYQISWLQDPNLFTHQQVLCFILLLRDDHAQEKA